jgi:hypothetical protein
MIFLYLSSWWFGGEECNGSTTMAAKNGSKNMVGSVPEFSCVQPLLGTAKNGSINMVNMVGLVLDIPLFILSGCGGDEGFQEYGGLGPWIFLYLSSSGGSEECFHNMVCSVLGFPILSRCSEECFYVCGTSLPSYLPISMYPLRRQSSSLLAAEPRPSYTVDSGMIGLTCEDNPFIHEGCRKTIIQLAVKT